MHPPTENRDKCSISRYPRPGSGRAGQLAATASEALHRKHTVDRLAADFTQKAASKLRYPISIESVLNANVPRCDHATTGIFAILAATNRK